MSFLSAIRRTDSVGAVFRDNAMFYKDITQWLRNRTFASLFFGLLLVAEILTIFVIGTADDNSQPGVTLFYGLYLVLIVYAMLIAYQGNSLTSREFSNRTFELFELSGMSLERMVGGKLFSMLYQFFFGFFCLVPFMFFAYILGGLDFIEMLVGVLVAALLAVPLYLFSLASALTARLKQVTLLVKMASGFFVVMVVFSMLTSLFSNKSVMQYFVQAFTELIKRMIDGSFEDTIYFACIMAVYTELCFLLFYLGCDNISRENDSRETPVKVFGGLLIISWLLIFVAGSASGVSVTRGQAAIAALPAFVAIMALGLRSFYSSPRLPIIVAKRHENSRGPIRWLFPIFKPGIEGACRSILLLTIVSVLLHSYVFGADVYTALLFQAPWFLVFPHILYASTKDIRTNYPAQRTLAVAAWVVLGAIILIVMAWTRMNLFTSDSSPFMIMSAALLSPLSSIATAGSSNTIVQESGAYARFISGAAGIVLMWLYTASVIRRDKKDLLEETAGRETVPSEPPAEPGTPEPLSESSTQAAAE